jgi:cytochrome d ubiquinol oxidase subunit I
MDVELLARIQFAFTIAFHYIFPPLSIAIEVPVFLAHTIGIYWIFRGKVKLGPDSY